MKLKLLIMFLGISLLGVSCGSPTPPGTLKISLEPDPSVNVQNYPFEYSIKAKQSNQYEQINHTLSPINDYHFSILKDKTWITLDNTLTEPLKQGESFEIGVFQKKQSDTDPNSKVQAEISVISRLRDPAVSPAKEVEMYLDHKFWVQNFKMVNKQAVPSNYGNGLDVIFSYDADGKNHIARVADIVSDKYIFFIQGDTLAENYSTYAQDFFAAISQFKLLR